MKFKSTRGNSPELTASEAILQGLAPDGGLYVPKIFPQIDWKSWNDSKSYSEIASDVISPFFENDPLQKEIPAICKSAFNFPVVLKNIQDEFSILELFHGPTAAFKDFGARFLSECMVRLNQSEKKLLILVATSGDTGGAVAAAFHKKPNTQVGILFPKGKVSARQEKQLTCWGDNIASFSVNGVFDDCQKLVKASFESDQFKSQYNLTSANSINLGRLLPQTVYYFFASVLYFSRTGKKPVFIIPSGNVGNASGAFWALKMGAPIEKIVLAVNSNKPIPDYFETGVWKPMPSVATLANAMDVGNPSNMERLLNLYPELNELKLVSDSLSVPDSKIEQMIMETYRSFGEIICPHTAVAEWVRRKYYHDQPSIIVSTAHPAKFETIVEHLIEMTIPIPQNLSDLLNKPSIFKEIGPELTQISF